MQEFFVFFVKLFANSFMENMYIVYLIYSKERIIR